MAATQQKPLTALPAKRMSLLSNSTVSTHDNRSATSLATVDTQGDGHLREVKQVARGMQRLNSPRLQSQRYTPSEDKMDDMMKMALVAKVERALERRMHHQDATYVPKLKVRITAPQATVSEAAKTDEKALEKS